MVRFFFKHFWHSSYCSRTYRFFDNLELKFYKNWTLKNAKAIGQELDNSLVSFVKIRKQLIYTINNSPVDNVIIFCSTYAFPFKPQITGYFFEKRRYFYGMNPYAPDIFQSHAKKFDTLKFRNIYCPKSASSFLLILKSYFSLMKCKLEIWRRDN